MGDKIIIRNDKEKCMLVTLRLNSEEVFTEKFKVFAEDLFICMLAKHIDKNGFMEPGKQLEAYFTKILEVAAKAASVLAHKTGKRLTCNENMENTMARVMGLLTGKEVEK